MGAILLIAQAIAAPGATPAAPPARAPDIELRARITAREVTVAQEGPIRLQVTVERGVSDVTVSRSQPSGARSYRNLQIDARVAAWLDAAGPTFSTDTVSTGEIPQ